MASKLQELAAGGVIHRFDAHHARGYGRGVCLEVLEEFELGGRRADDQDLARVPDRVGDSLIVRVILWSFAGADNAVFVVQVLMFRLRMDDTCFRVVRVELDDMRFAVIDPHDAVIVAH